MGEVRHFLDLHDLSGETVREILEAARVRKRARKNLSSGVLDKDAPLAGYLLTLFFSQPSTRTRVSFEVAMRQLGGGVLSFEGAQSQMSRGESAADTARVLSRYVDAVGVRTPDHTVLEEMARYARVPILNLLTNRSHPCQVMADVMTFGEHCGSIQGCKIAWVGDSNNVTASWIHAAAHFDFSLTIASPEGCGPSEESLRWARERGARVRWVLDPREAVRGAACVLTDVWRSMGDTKGDTQDKAELLKPYQVTSALMSEADSNAIFMHCLPAHRGQEVAQDVLEGRQSVVFDEAENRLHVQKAILLWCFGKSLL